MTTTQVAYIEINNRDYVITCFENKFGVGRLGGRVKYMRVSPYHDGMNLLKTVIHWRGTARELYERFTMGNVHLIYPYEAEKLLHHVLNTGKGVR